MTIRPDVSDEYLVQRYKDGDADAFESLYQRYLPLVYKRVRFVVPEPDIEDVTQEVFIAVLKSLHAFRGDSQFSTWLRTLVNYKVAEFYRKRNRKQDPREAPLADAEVLPEEDDLPIEERIALRTAMSSLPEKYQEVILLRFADGMSFEEIARVIGANLEATKSLFRRSLSALRKNLEPKL